MAMPRGHQGPQPWTPSQSYSTPIQSTSPPYRPPTAIPWVPTQGGNMMRTPPQGPAAQLATQQSTPTAHAFTPQNPSRLQRAWSVGSASSQESAGGLSVVTNDSEGFPTVRSHSSKSLKERQEWREKREREQEQERQHQQTPTNAQVHAPQPHVLPPEAPMNAAAPPESTVPPGYMAGDRGQAHLYDRPLEQVPTHYPPVNIGPNRLGWHQPGPPPPPPGTAPVPYPQGNPPPPVPQGPLQVAEYPPSFGQGPPAACPNPGYGPPAPPARMPITPPLHHYLPPIAPVPSPMLDPPQASALDIQVPADISPRYFPSQAPRGPRGGRGRGKHGRSMSNLDPSAKPWGPG